MSASADSKDQFEILCTNLKAFREKNRKNTRVPDKFRKAIGEAVRSGRSIPEVSRLSGLSKTVVQRWSSRKSVTKNVESPLLPKAQILDIVQPPGASPQIRISCESGCFVIDLTVSQTRVSV